MKLPRYLKINKTRCENGTITMTIIAEKNIYYYLFFLQILFKLIKEKPIEVYKKKESKR